MNQKFNLSIDKPCSEKFSSFQPTHAGGFCQSCQKEVTDFTRMSEHELIEYFQNRQSKVCGKFKHSQLKTYSEMIAPKRKPLFSLFGISLMGLSVLSFLSPQQVRANTATYPSKFQITQSEGKKSERKEVKTKTDTFTVTGTVKDDSGEVLPGATVTIKGTTRGSYADIDGKFAIKVKEGDILIFNYIGFESKEVTVKNGVSKLDIVVLMYEHELLGKVSTTKVYSSKRSFWQRFKNLFR